MSRRNFQLSSSKHLPEEPVINLTPLIDVVFVVLIMFIVVAPLLELDRVELADTALASHEKVTTVQEMSRIAIYVRQDNSILVDGRPIALNQLTDYLIEAKKKFPDAKPQLFHDRKAHFGTYQTIKNAAEAAGFQQLDVILKPS